MTVKLNDLQRILLSSASNREDGSLLPMPDSVATDTDRTTTAITSLVRRKLAIRSNDHVFITDAGRTAIGTADTGILEKGEACITPPGTTGAGASEIPEQCDDMDAPSACITPPLDIPAVLSTASTSIEVPIPVAARPGSKIALLADLLSREDGATLDVMTSATGWQPHTVRAALSGLRKKGHAIASDKVDGTRIWRIER
ncbi:MAG: DUF3489 domain-containing protein [Novosphingobium sp.]